MSRRSFLVQVPLLATAARALASASASGERIDGEFRAQARRRRLATIEKTPDSRRVIVSRPAGGALPAAR